MEDWIDGMMEIRNIELCSLLLSKKLGIGEGEQGGRKLHKANCKKQIMPNTQIPIFKTVYSMAFVIWRLRFGILI